MRIWITEPQTLCQREEAPVLWLCLFWWHCWDQDWREAVWDSPKHKHRASSLCSVPSQLTSLSPAPAARLMLCPGKHFPADKPSWQQAAGRMGFSKSPAYTLLTRHPLPPTAFHSNIDLSRLSDLSY